MSIPTGQRHGKASSSRSGALVPTLLILGGLALAFLLFTSFYTDLLWFRSVEMSKVFTTMLWTRVLLFVVFGLLMAIPVAVNMFIAYRTRPEMGIMSVEQVSLERYRASLEPFRKLLLIGVPAGLGVLAGMSASAQWRAFLTWRNSTEFGAADPQFGMDISFYVMDYPFWRFLVGFAFAVLLVCLLFTIITHYVYGGLRVQSAGERASQAAHVHISILLGLLMLLKAAAYWLDRYGLAVKSEDLVTGFTGLKYRDVYAVLPAKNILMIIALVCAVLFFANAWRRTWTLPLVAVGLLAVSSLLIGGIYPAIVQQFQVRPSELVREQEYIKRNIEATRAAYGLSEAQVQEYSGDAPATAQALAKDAGTLNSVRLLDPAVVSPTFRQLQQIKGFYSFPDILDVDRYPIDGGTKGAVVAAREVNLSGVGERNWANDHVVFTHGYGLVAAYDNNALPDGRPNFFSYDIPTEGKLEITQPRIYFGEESPDYSIVGAPEGSEPRELDYPDDDSPTGQRNNTYTGSGGVPIGSLLHRAMFATRFQDPNILLSDLVNEKSRIMFDRDPLTIVGKVAPWLTLDRDPYPIVVSGRIQWVVDGYTTSATYPYSSRTTLSDATEDAITASSTAVQALPREQINYIRNSVKATVDAFDGTVRIYAWDSEDPVLQTWSRAFGGVVRPMADAPGDVVAHARYAEDIFKVQRTILSRYHVTDPTSFYNGQDFWTIPIDPTNRSINALQPPYYLSLRMPGQERATFSLTTTFAPLKRQTLAAFMAVNSAPGPDYGTIRVLQLPRNTTVPGPTQVQNNFESETAIAEQLTLLRRGGADVEFGNLLSLPVSGGLLYVEPVFVRATQGQGYPLLRKVLAGYGNEVVMADTFGEALEALFAGKATSSESGTGSGEASGSGSGSASGSGSEQSATKDLAEAIADADAAYESGQQALRKGDFTAYDKAQKQLRDALDRAMAAERRLLAGSESGSDSAATASPTPTSSETPLPESDTGDASLESGTSPPAIPEISPLPDTGLSSP